MDLSAQNRISPFEAIISNPKKLPADFFVEFIFYFRQIAFHSGSQFLVYQYLKFGGIRLFGAAAEMLKNVAVNKHRRFNFCIARIYLARPTAENMFAGAWKCRHQSNL
jgi:hypothetical protein